MKIISYKLKEIKKIGGDVINKKSLTILLLLLTMSIFTIQAYAVSSGVVEFSAIVSPNVSSNIDVTVLNKSTSLAYNVSLTKENNYLTRAYLPYGEYIFMSINSDDKKADLYTFRTGKPFKVSNNLSIVNLFVNKGESSYGWITFNVEVPEGFKDNLILELSNGQSFSYELENNHIYTKLPYGEYELSVTFEDNLNASNYDIIYEDEIIFNDSNDESTFDITVQELKEQVKESPEIGELSNKEVARQVIQGKFGNGAERKTNLERAGYNYNEIQEEISKIIKVSKTKPANKTIVSKPITTPNKKVEKVEEVKEVVEVEVVEEVEDSKDIDEVKEVEKTEDVEEIEDVEEEAEEKKAGNKIVSIILIIILLGLAGFVGYLFIRYLKGIK